MKYVFIALILLSLTLYPLLVLTSCTEEELESETKTHRERPDDSTFSTDIEELEKQAEEARERLIESINETRSRPDIVRALDGESVELSVPGNTQETDTNSEV